MKKLVMMGLFTVVMIQSASGMQYVNSWLVSPLINGIMRAGSLVISPVPLISGKTVAEALQAYQENKIRDRRNLGLRSLIIGSSAALAAYAARSLPCINTVVQKLSFNAGASCVAGIGLVSALASIVKHYTSQNYKNRQLEFQALQTMQTLIAENTLKRLKAQTPLTVAELDGEVRACNDLSASSVGNAQFSAEAILRPVMQKIRWETK